VPFDPNRLVVCEVSISTVGPVYLVSVHAPTTNADPVEWCHRALDQIDALVHAHPAIVGGDLNASRTAERWWPGAGNGPLFDRIDAGSLLDCHRKFNKEEEQTYFSKRGVPIQDDHIFMTRSLADLATKCYAVNNEEARSVSDHIPVVADLALASGGSSLSP
jgi:endonuclease/exonuclease/phosphatase family metal-dependent hydrolase